MIFLKKEVNIKFKEMTRFAVGALNILCTRMMPCTVTCGSRGHTEDAYERNNSFTPWNRWGRFLPIWRGNIFHISKKHYILWLRQHCIGKESAFMLLTLLACHLFLHLTKLLAALFPTWMCRVPFMLRSCFYRPAQGSFRTMWRQREASGVGWGQTSNRGVWMGPERRSCAGE